MFMRRGEYILRPAYIRCRRYRSLCISLAAVLLPGDEFFSRHKDTLSVSLELFYGSPNIVQSAASEKKYQKVLLLKSPASHHLELTDGPIEGRDDAPLLHVSEILDTIVLLIPE